jgi:hypothetical protein
VRPCGISELQGASWEGLKDGNHCQQRVKVLLLWKTDLVFLLSDRPKLLQRKNVACFGPASCRAYWLKFLAPLLFLLSENSSVLYETLVLLSQSSALSTAISCLASVQAPVLFLTRFFLHETAYIPNNSRVRPLSVASPDSERTGGITDATQTHSLTSHSSSPCHLTTHTAGPSVIYVSFLTSHTAMRPSMAVFWVYSAV